MTALGRLSRTTAFKLSVAYLVLFSLGAALVLGGVGFRVKEVLDEQTGQTIDAELARLADRFAEGGIRQLIRSVQLRARAPGGSLFLVTTFGGDYLAGNIAPSARLPTDAKTLTEAVYHRFDLDDGEHLALMRVLELQGGFLLFVGHDMEDRRMLRQILRNGLGASLLWLVSIGTLGGLLVAHRMLERVDTMSASARRIMAGDLDQRLAVSGAGDEFDRLASNLNAMLARIGELMAGLREVSDNIAHDLKTPLTRLRNRAEEALRQRAEDEPGRAALAAIIDEADALIGVFDALLLIARAEAGYSSDYMVAFDASEATRDMVELYQPSAEEQNVALDATIEPGLFVVGHRELLAQALVNLFDNALKYGVADKDPRIVVSARRVGPRVEICIADNGCGIAEEDRERVKMRFVRLDKGMRRPGSGLGLSLVSAVVRLHRGEMRIEDNQPGLRVVLALPATNPVLASTAAAGAE